MRSTATGWRRVVSLRLRVMGEEPAILAGQKAGGPSHVTRTSPLANDGARDDKASSRSEQVLLHSLQSCDELLREIIVRLRPKPTRGGASVGLEFLSEIDQLQDIVADFPLCFFVQCNVLLNE